MTSNVAGPDTVVSRPIECASAAEKSIGAPVGWVTDSPATTTWTESAWGDR